ncbi:type III-A CRISPR-associated RAMP protein Csm3 [Syntrophomonas wolfei]|nr:type III-A CRISPR-associated RAMP protein Csm3 [Syntrophomonas wolfei]
MYGKILIKCKMTVLTGMHIGGSSAFSAIGAVDSPVIRDSFTGEPMLPGSSLKGKMRTLLAKAIKNHYITQEPAKDPEEIKRLFGTAGDNRKQEWPKAARLQFYDAFLVNADTLKNRSGMTEVKFENTINRLTAIANPRQIERVVRGSEFAINLVYDMEDTDSLKSDFTNIARGLKLLSMDYLGGHGSRGYGKVGFTDFEVVVKEGECPEDVDLLLKILKEVEDYGAFSLQA